MRIERGLLELDIGKRMGMALKDAGSKPEWKAVQQHPSGFRFDGGESLTETRARITGAIARMVAQHPGRLITLKRENAGAPRWRRPAGTRAPAGSET